MIPIGIHGQVTQGAQRGRHLGFPTFNIMAEDPSLTDGVYVSVTQLENAAGENKGLSTEELPSVTFVGTPKMFDDLQWRIETHILDFNQDIYGQTVTVTLLKKLRDAINFSAPEELIEQINKDIELVRAYFQDQKK
jgi:FAD synthase